MIHLLLIILNAQDTPYKSSGSSMRFDSPSQGSGLGASKTTSAGNIMETEIAYVREGGAIQTSRWCGDGDVTNYYADKKDHVVFKGTEGKIWVTLGMWIGDGSNNLPSKDNWYGLAYHVMESAADTSKLTDMGAPLTSTGSTGSVASYLRTGLNTIAEQINNQQAKGVKKIYAGVIACMHPWITPRDLTNEDTGYISDQPNFESMYKMVSKIGDDSSIIPDLGNSLAVTIDDGTLKIEDGTGKTGNDKTFLFSLGSGETSTLLGLYNDLKDIDCTSDANKDKPVCDINSYKKYFDKSTACSLTPNKYWWQVGAYSTACNFISKNSVDSLGSDNKDLANVFYKAAVISEAEKTLNAKMKNPTISCFSRPDYIESILASVPIPLKYDSGKIKLSEDSRPRQMVHPEGGFAIGQYRDYYGAEGNLQTIFGMTGSRKDNMEKDGADISEATTLEVEPGGPSPSITLKIRGINCAPGNGGGAFCYNKNSDECYFAIK